MIVAGREDGQVVGGRDSGGVGTLAVSCCKSILCDGGLANIVSTFCANEETFVTESDVHGGGRSLEEVGEQTGVDVGLLVEEVQLSAIGALRWQVVGEDFGFQALGQVVLKLELGVEAV